MVSLLVAFQEVLHAAIMLISEIIARAPTMGVNVVYGTVSLLVVIQKALRVMTMLISEIIDRVLTKGMIEPTVVYGIDNLHVVFQDALRTVITLEIIAWAKAMNTIIVFAPVNNVGETGFCR